MLAKTSKPEAYIAVNGNRQKIYGSSEIYLNDGTEFQIELFNPTQTTVAAKIHINGKSISESMIVVRPGRREYLDRFIDRNSKLLFETYRVEDSAESKSAIAHNGSIKIEFYEETVSNGYVYPAYPAYPTLGPSFPHSFPNIWYGTSTNVCTDELSYCTGTSGPIGVNGTPGLTGSAGISGMLNEVETGRVEAGASSNQNFDTYNGNFGWFPVATVEYKLLPVSQKPVEVSQIRNYCTGCGNRIRKSSWKFCPGCGERL